MNKKNSLFLSSLIFIFFVFSCGNNANASSQISNSILNNRSNERIVYANSLVTSVGNEGVNIRFINGLHLSDKDISYDEWVSDHSNVLVRYGGIQWSEKIWLKGIISSYDKNSISIENFFIYRNHINIGIPNPGYWGTRLNYSRIEDYAFEGVNSFKSIIIYYDGRNLYPPLQIGRGAFKNCINLAGEIKLGDSDVEPEAFYGCTNISSFIVKDSLQNYNDWLPWKPLEIVDLEGPLKRIIGPKMAINNIDIGGVKPLYTILDQINLFPIINYLGGDNQRDPQLIYEWEVIKKNGEIKKYNIENLVIDRIDGSFNNAQINLKITEWGAFIHNSSTKTINVDSPFSNTTLESGVANKGIAVDGELSDIIINNNLLIDSNFINLTKTFVVNNFNRIFINYPNVSNYNEEILDFSLSIVNDDITQLNCSVTLKSALVSSILTKKTFSFKLTNFLRYRIEINSNIVIRLVGFEEIVNTSFNEISAKVKIIENKDKIFRYIGDVPNDFNFDKNLEVNVEAIEHNEFVKANIKLNNSSSKINSSVSNFVIFNGFKKKPTIINNSVDRNGIIANESIKIYTASYLSESEHLNALIKPWIVENFYNIFTSYSKDFNIDEIKTLNSRVISNNELSVNVALKNSYLNEKLEIGEKTYTFRITSLSNWNILFTNKSSFELDKNSFITSDNVDDIKKMIVALFDKVFIQYGSVNKNNIILHIRNIKLDYSGVRCQITIKNNEYYNLPTPLPTVKDIKISKIKESSSEVSLPLIIGICSGVGATILISIIILIIIKRRR